MWYIIIIVIVVVIVWRIIHNANDYDEEIEERNRIRSENERKRRKEEEEKFNTGYNEYITRFGECTAEINLGGWNEHRIDRCLLVFETANIVIINSAEYKFKDILGFSLVDDETSETITTSIGNAKTSTGSMIGRAVVGGVLTGGLGAVAGAATAKKNINTDATSQTKTKHNYTLYINVNDIKDPIISINIGNGSIKAQKLAAIFNIIIERNKSNADPHQDLLPLP